jgi:hypothetical protein
MKFDLSLLIPSRNEAFLRHTIDDILRNSGERTEVIAVLDGQLPVEPIPDHPRVTLVFVGKKSIGQRAATNLAARLSKAKCVMKVDAHCAFDKDFDEKMLTAFEETGGDVTMVPTMRNLHAFDWVCEEGHRRYQGPSGPCETCGKETKQDIVWRAKNSPQSNSFCFTSEPKFGYFKEYSKRPEGRGDLTETMSLQGSCFTLTRAKYWELNICDETFGSWGSQGIEVACRTWLSGGRVLVNHRTWYAHLFRTQGGDFSFPYHLPGRQVDHAKKTARELFFNNKWDKAIRPLSWLVERFHPVPGWSADDLAELKAKEGTAAASSKVALYYTCNTHRPEIDDQCRAQLQKCKLPIVSVSLNRELDFGDTRLTMDGTRSPLTMHKQILKGLEASAADFVFLCESDVLYHPCHFDFTPPRRDTFYFNINVWKMDYFTGRAVWTDDLQQLSGMVASRELMLAFFRERVKQIESSGFNSHYEPSHKQKMSFECKTENYRSSLPNVCIRHDANITKSKWSPQDFRNPQYAKGWTESEAVPGWGAIGPQLTGVTNAGCE